MRFRNKKPLLKQNCSQRQGKGHQPSVLHKAVSLIASRRGATAPGSCFSSATFGVTPDLAVQDMVPSPEDWAASAPSTRGIPFPQLPFCTACAPCRQMGVKVICQSKISNLIMVHLFSVRIYVPSTPLSWPPLSL